MRFKNDSLIKELKISEVGTYEDGGDDAFEIGSKVGVSEVWVVSSSS